MTITATSLKLPAALKAELEKLARRSGETTHALMVRALTEHVAAAADRYRSFLDDAKRANAAMCANGIGYAMQDVHAYILAKASGEKVKRPRPVKWKRNCANG